MTKWSGRKCEVWLYYVSLLTDKMEWQGVRSVVMLCKLMLTDKMEWQRVRSVVILCKLNGVT